MPNGDKKQGTLGAGKAPGPAGKAGTADDARGPEGLRAGEQAAQGPPALNAPKDALSSKTFSYFSDQVRILVVLAAHPPVTRQSLKTIRSTAKNDPEKQVGYTEASLKIGDVKDTPVAGKSYFTAVATLKASKMVLPSDLWVEDKKLTTTTDPTELGRLKAYRAAYDDILRHEQKHMTEAFDYVSEVSLGVESTYGLPSSTLPDLKAFQAKMKAAETKAGAADGPLRKSAEAWDKKDLDDIRSRQREVYITIETGPDPRIFYHPPKP
jgi:hypothetical protein